MDHEAIYDERISPLMAQVIAICQEVGIPMVADFQLTDGDDPLYCATVVPGDDRASRHMRRIQIIVSAGAREMA